MDAKGRPPPLAERRVGAGLLPSLGLFILFALLYLVFTVYNDIVGYQAAVVAGKPALINSAFGAALTLVGAPIYLFFRARQPDRT